MIGGVMKVDEATRTAFEREVTNKWQPFRTNGGMNLEVRITTAIGWASLAMVGSPAQGDRLLARAGTVDQPVNSAVRRSCGASTCLAASSV